MSKEFYGFDDQDFELPPPADRKHMIHETIFRAVMLALKIAQPRLPEAGATPIALNAAIHATDEIEKNLQERLQTRPVAFRVRGYADDWIFYNDEATAYRYAEETGSLMQGLYVRDGT